MPTLLVVDDEPAILHAFRRAFRQPEVTLLTAGTPGEGIELTARHRPDVIILDVEMPGIPGLEVLRRIRQFDAKVPVIFITGHAGTETAIEAIKLGAMDYLFKPLELSEVRDLVSRALTISRLMRIPPALPDETPSDAAADLLIGRCPPMREVYMAVGRVAPQDVAVLVLGESGTGKELVAQAIYHHSKRAGRPFRIVNCAAIPEALLESELFGHEKGAFTGADRMRVGKFEQAAGGVFFLDEIGDMTPLTQAKVLRFLQDRQFERVGGNEVLQADVRVIAATNRNLAQMVADGQFRADLYYRLSVFTISLPPLRERGDDVRLLAEYYLRRYARELGKDVREISPDAYSLLQKYRWPGNIRELQSVIKQSLLCASGPVLAADFLPAALCGEGKDSTAATPTTPVVPLLAPADWHRFLAERLRADSQNLYSEWSAMTERYLLTAVLQHLGGNLTHASRMLGINRRTLRLRLAELGIERE